MKLYVIGIGPGGRERMTPEAVHAIEDSQAIVGYKPYLEYIEDLIGDRETFSTGMTGEIERCNQAIDLALQGKNVSIISTGDAGLYGMAGPIYELVEERKADVEVVVVPGVSAQFSAAADLGAPIMHDIATISLSDLLTPYDLIMKRVDLAAQGDFVIALYNPRSKTRKDHLKNAFDLIKKYQKGSTPVGIVKDSGRPGTETTITTLDDIDYETVDMKTIVIVGNSETFVANGKMITPRGYRNL